MLGTMAAIYDAGGKKLFDEKNPEDIIVALKEDHHDAYEEIVNHSRRYLWINNNYRRAVVLGPLDFIIKMKDESISFNHPSDELSLMEETKKTTIEKKKEYLSLLEEDEKLMAELLAEGTWLQDERKRCNLIGDHVLTEFLKELSARTGVSLDILHNASVFEFGAILNGKADIDAIARRHEDYFTIYTEYSLKHRKLVAGPGRRYDVSDVEHTDEFRGTPASLGKTEGKVVVITKEEDFGKMKDGAILVSVMTRPEYTPLMKRASGIITDEGGLTCHAAVVSREFKIPCIVGTRHATRILKDGDIVELDAAKGLVRLKRP
jgi:phosphohistidine swiveling domain-containing protein